VRRKSGKKGKNKKKRKREREKIVAGK